MKTLRPLAESLLIHALLGGALFAIGKAAAASTPLLTRLDISLAAPASGSAKGNLLAVPAGPPPGGAEKASSSPVAAIKQPRETARQPAKTVPLPPEPVGELPVKVFSPRERVQEMATLPAAVRQEDVSESVELPAPAPAPLRKDLPPPSILTEVSMDSPGSVSSVTPGGHTGSLSASTLPEVATAAEGSSDAGTVPIAGGETWTAEAGYNQDHFGPIRDAIHGRLRYPLSARRQGWSGRVEIGFRVGVRGEVENVRVLSSSGYPVLDREALEAVRKASPFPPPSVTMQLVMPVTFALN